jgi:hypothetical protein
MSPTSEIPPSNAETMDLDAKMEALRAENKALREALREVLQAQNQGVSSEQIQPGIEALQAQIQDVSPTEILHFKSALQAQLSLIRASDNASPVEILLKWLARIKSTTKVKKINAREATIPQILDIFGLRFDKDRLWSLAENNLVKLPLRLMFNLDDLKAALYDEYSEATCRITVDILLIQCRIYLNTKHQSATTSHDVETNVTDATNPSTPKMAIPNIEPIKQPIKPVKLFPEFSLSIQMDKKNGKFLVTSRADWAMGYSNVGDEGAILVAIEAKQESEFSKGRAQLIAYLAILRENRLRAGKKNIVTQGFYSDGSRFAFICITADGSIEQSPIFNINWEEDLKIVFSFIVTMMETAIKSTPNASPTKPAQLQEKEIDHFEDEVWSKVYELMDKSIVTGLVEDFEMGDEPVDAIWK